jgi:hypothetical protein
MLEADAQLKIMLQYNKWGCTKAKYNDLRALIDSMLTTLRKQNIAREIFAQINEICLSKDKYSSK